MCSSLGKRPRMGFDEQSQPKHEASVNNNNVVCDDAEANNNINSDYNYCFPPGFRFRPYDDELIVHYLKKKIMNEPLPYHINDVNLYRHNPETLAENFEMLGEKEWYFFTPRDRKYRNGSRPNRAAGNGYWKATGADKPIKANGVVVGSRKALVFYGGKPPSGTKTHWIMHEYKANEPSKPKNNGDDMRLDDWVLCRLYKKADKSIINRDDEGRNSVQDSSSTLSEENSPPIISTTTSHLQQQNTTTTITTTNNNSNDDDHHIQDMNGGDYMINAYNEFLHQQPPPFPNEILLPQDVAYFAAAAAADASLGNNNYPNFNNNNNNVHEQQHPLAVFNYGAAAARPICSIMPPHLLPSPPQQMPAMNNNIFSFKYLAENSDCMTLRDQEEEESSYNWGWKPKVEAGQQQEDYYASWAIMNNNNNASIDDMMMLPPPLPLPPNNGDTYLGDWEMPPPQYDFSSNRNGGNDTTVIKSEEVHQLTSQSQKFDNLEGHTEEEAAD